MNYLFVIVTLIVNNYFWRKRVVIGITLHLHTNLPKYGINEIRETALSALRMSLLHSVPVSAEKCAQRGNSRQS